MSLVENIARRWQSPIELVGAPGRLTKKYKALDIAAPLSVTTDFASAIAFLIKHGEDRLISAVESNVAFPTLPSRSHVSKHPSSVAPCLKAM